jgi:hypothetical protein
MPWRNIIRWAALIGTVAVVVWLAPSANRNYREWRETAVNDPSAAELYQTALWVDAAGIATGFIVGAFIFFGVKPKNEPPRVTSGGPTQS